MKKLFCPVSGMYFLFIQICLTGLIAVAQLFFVGSLINAQNIFNGEPVQVVGPFNGYATDPYEGDYRTTNHRQVMTMAFPTDGRSQWTTTINVQNLGGDVLPVNMPGGPGNGFLFISGPISNRFQNKWVFFDVAQATLNDCNVNTCYNCGQDMGLDMSSPGYYTFVFNDCGYTAIDAAYYVARTSNPPVQPSRSSETINNDGSVTVGISLDAALSPEEHVFVRYTTDGDFTGPNTGIVEATGSGMSYSALTPVFPDGTIVTYYIFTSTRELLDLIAEIIRNIFLSILRLDDNLRSGYTTTVQLPVEMISFSARPEGNTISLSWATATETNSDYFEIQHSTNGEDFKVLGTTKGAGDSPSPSYYSYVDTDPVPGVNYYRLRQVDFGGAFEFSRIITVEYATEGVAFIYPSPALQEIRIGGIQENTNFSIRNVLGHQCLSGTAGPGQTIDISALSPGSYIWQGDRAVLRFFKL